MIDELKNHYGIEDNKIIGVGYYKDGVVENTVIKDTVIIDCFNVRYKVNGDVFSKWYFKKISFELNHGFCECGKEIEFYWKGNMLK